MNQVFYPDVVATAQYLADLALELKKSGHEVTVLAARRGYLEPHPIYPAQENFQGIRIVRVWPFTLGKKNRVGRILDMAFLNMAFFVRFLRLPRFDVVVALTSPPLVAATACFAAKVRGSRFVYWVMDMNPDEAIAMGWLKKKSIVARILESTSSWTFQKSDRIVALDRYMKKRIVAKGVQEHRITVIPPWTHDEDLRLIQHDQNPFRKCHKLENKFVVMYSGNHSVCHPLETLLETARLLKDDPGVLFMFIGGGARTEDVRLFKEKHQLHNILQITYQARSEIRYSLSAADLHVVVMGAKLVGIVHPCKIYGILALGRPFLCIGPLKSHVGDLIAGGAIGDAVAYGDTVKMLNLIQCGRNLREDQLESIRGKNKKAAESFSSYRLVPRMIEQLIRVSIGDRS